VARLRASRPFCMKHALLGAAQLATVVVGANHPAYGQCTQSSPCASLTKLGTLGGVASGVTLPEDLLFGAHATSSDGSVVVGGSLTPHKGIHPFRWTSATGTVDLGTLQAGTADVVPTSRALYISSNGSVVAGIESDPDSTTRVFRWTSATGMIDLGTLGGNHQSSILGMSSDGSVIVGYSDTATRNRHAFRWASATGLMDLGTLGGDESFAFGVSSDGSTVVGESDRPSTGSPPRNHHAFRWTGATGMVDLGTLGGEESEATGTNSDGSVVVGDSDTTTGSGRHAFRWTSATGMVDLGIVVRSGSTLTTSRDGSVVVGSHAHLFRWTSATGTVDLGTLEGSAFASPTGVSSDGSVIVGNSGSRPFRWTSASGMQDVNTLLSNAGVNMTDTTLTEASGASEDGKFIIGLGHFPGSIVSPYIARFAD
jgi:probable HAF family extracellular repeat protein